MRKFFSALVLLPLGVILVAFAVANRHPVTVSFDPFNTINSSFSVTVPLFAVIIAVAIMGVVAGGVATWLRQRHWRRAARMHEADAQRAHHELADLRRPAMSQRSDLQRLPASGPGYRAVERDKSGATL